MNAQLAMSYKTCQAITRQNGKSFYFASFTLPKAKRNALYALYAFCRIADDLVDEGGPARSHAIQARLERLREEVMAIYACEPTSGGVFLALADTIRRYRIPQQPFHDLLKGVAMDLEKTRYRTYAELETYCYHVASVVGLMLSHVFGFRDERALHYASALGKAMQLTNILRDVGEDHRMGRIYLPQEELDAFGYNEGDLTGRVVDQRFVELMRFQIQRARQLYAYALEGLRAQHEPSWFTARLMGRLYAGILDAIERQGYDVFRQRARVTTAQKVRRLVSSGLEALRPASLSAAAEPLLRP